MMHKKTRHCERGQRCSGQRQRQDQEEQADALSICLNKHNGKHSPDEIGVRHG